MTGAARIMLRGLVVGLLVVTLAGVVGAEEQAPPAQTETRTWGAPVELREAAVLVHRLIKERKFDQARAVCQEAYNSPADDETRALALRGIGEAYKEEYLMDRAIEIFQQVIEQYPQSKQVSWAKLSIAESYTYKAEVARPQENIALAMPILEQFLKDYPNHERAERALKFRGWCYERLGKEEAALAEYQKAVDLYPKHRWTKGCLMRVIELQQKFGRWDDAIASARRYIELFPDRGPASAQLSIGFSYAGKGDLGAAVQEFGKVLTQYPDSKGQCAMALFQTGLGQRALGQLAGARQTFEQLIQTCPDDYLAVQAQRELEMMGAQ